MTQSGMEEGSIQNFYLVWRKDPYRIFIWYGGRLDIECLSGMEEGNPLKKFQSKIPRTFGGDRSLNEFKIYTLSISLSRFKILYVITLRMGDCSRAHLEMSKSENYLES